MPLVAIVGPPPGIHATISVSSPALLPVVNNPTQTIGFVLLGLSVTNSIPPAFQQCSSQTFAAAGSVTLKKGYADAFRARSVTTTPVAPGDFGEQDVPGVVYRSETQFYNPALLGGAARTADFGTRFRIVFANVSPGVTIWLPTSVGYDSNAATPNFVNVPASTLSATTSLYAILTGSESGPFSPVSANGAGAAAGYSSLVIDPTGKGEAVYEVLQADSANLVENLSIPYYVSYTGSPAAGTTTVAAGFAPVSAISAASAPDPIPRFIDTSTAQAAFSISACTSPSPQITAPTALQFNYITGSNSPAPQNISIQSTNPSSGVAFTLSKGAGCNWLVLNPMSGTTPVTISTSVNPGGLTPGQHECAVNMSAPAVSGNLPVIAASVAVTTQIWASPPGLAFSFVLGGGPPSAQTISIGSTSPTAFAASTGSGCNWLGLGPADGTTPAIIYASAHTIGLPPGNYRCAITITSPNASNGAQIVNATLVIMQPTSILVTPSTPSFTYRLGSSAPPTQTIVVSSTPASGVSFSVAPGKDCGWLDLRATSSVTPFVLTAWVNTAGLTPSTYTCSLTITSPIAINGPQTVQASLTVSDRPTLRASPVSLTFNAAGSGQPPQPQTIFLFAGGAVGVSAASSDSWMSLSFASAVTPATLGVSVNPAGLTPGTYQGSIAIHSPAGNPVSQTLPITLNVAGGAVELLSQPEVYWFSFVQGAREPQTRREIVTGSGPYHATSDCSWLSITPRDGTLSATAPAFLTIAADPTGMVPGTYTGSVSVSGPRSGTLLKAFVGMTVSHNAEYLSLSHTGMGFRVAKGGIAPPQTLYIAGNGSAAMNWSVIPSTLSGGNWLSASPETGAVDELPSSVHVSVNAADLASGDYHGQLVVSSADTANSPLMVGVVLSVSPESTLGPSVDPVGLIVTGSTSPQQTISIVNRAGGPMSFESSAFFPDGHAWFTVQPASGTVSAGGAQVISVLPSVLGLPAGTVYSGQLDLGFGDGSAQRVSLLLAVAPPPAASAQHATASCVPKDVIPLITSLGGESAASLGRPLAIEVKVVDNCGGTPQGSGSIQLDFSNNDSSVALVPMSGGLWTGTVTPRGIAVAPFEISVQGQIGTETLVPYTRTLNFGDASAQPFVATNGVSSAASYAPQAAIAPGSLINIYGSHLADRPGQYSGYPLPKQLAGTQVLLAEKAMPLMLVNEDRILAQVPYEIGINMTHQLVVQRGASQSAPETLPVAPAQPAVFTANQQGTGQAIVIVGNTGHLADAAHPVKAGDEIVIFCSGLGAVTPRVASGAAAPSKPLSKTETPNLTIGGRPAEVLFSGLAPGFAGLYHVRAVVPHGVAPGAEVPIVLTVAGQNSPVVTIAVK